MRRRSAQLLLLPVALATAGAAGGYAAWVVGSDDARVDAGNAPPARVDATRSRERPTEARSVKSTVPEARDARPAAGPPVPADPPRLEIPAIGVRAHAIRLGTDADNRLKVPVNWSEVGWWDGGAAPGARGAAVVVGHVDSKTGPAVFHRLRELHPGDEIRFVRRSGAVARFVVERTTSRSKKDFPTREVYARTKTPSLRLVTCDGAFDWKSGHYRSNLIVFAAKA